VVRSKITKSNHILENLLKQRIIRSQICDYLRHNNLSLNSEPMMPITHVA